MACLGPAVLGMAMLGVAVAVHLADHTTPIPILDDVPILTEKSHSPKGQQNLEEMQASDDVPIVTEKGHGTQGPPELKDTGAEKMQIDMATGAEKLTTGSGPEDPQDSSTSKAVPVSTIGGGGGAFDSKVLVAKLSPKVGGMALVVGSDRVVRLWNPSTPNLADQAVPQGAGECRSARAAFSPDGHRALTCCGSTCTLSHVLDPMLVPQRSAKEGVAVRSVVWSPTRDRVLTAFSPDAAKKSRVVVWDAETGDESWRVVLVAPEPCKPEPGGFGCYKSKDLEPELEQVLAATSSGDHFLTFSAVTGSETVSHITTWLSLQVRVWNAANGELSRTVPMQDFGRVSTRRGGLHMIARFSPDGTRILTQTNAYGTFLDKWDFQVWDTTTGKSLWSMKSRGARKHTSFWVGRGGESRLAVSVCPGDLSQPEFWRTTLWNASTLEAIATWDGKGVSHSQLHYQESVETSPDGRRILVADLYHAELWDLATGETLATLQGHTALVVSAAFSPDGAHALTRDYDGTAKFWRLPA